MTKGEKREAAEPAHERLGRDETEEEAKKRAAFEERKRRRAERMRRKLAEVAVTPVWASVVVFEFVTGIKRRRAYELAAAGVVRTKKDGAATRWNVADGLAHMDAMAAAMIRLSPAQRKKMAEAEADDAAHRVAETSAS